MPDPPVVDSSLGTVLVFVGRRWPRRPDDPDNAFAAQASTTGAVRLRQRAGKRRRLYVRFRSDRSRVAESGTQIHSGDFDNNYYESNGTPGSVAGFMYVCAIDPNGESTVLRAGNTALRQISFDNNGMIFGVNPLFLKVADDPYDECSPVTEVYNPNVNCRSGRT